MVSIKAHLKFDWNSELRADGIEESRLQLCDPHLEVEFVIWIRIALHIGSTVEVVQVEVSDVVHAGCCADDAGLCTAG